MSALIEKCSKQSRVLASRSRGKASRVVKVYLAPTAIEIQERYSGKKTKGIFPFMSTGKLNDLVRVAMKEAGIDRVVTIVNPRAKQSEQHPICDIDDDMIREMTNLLD